MPPSTTRLAPLIKDPSSPETNSTASFQLSHRFTAAGNSCIVYTDIQGAGFFSNLMYFSPFFLFIHIGRKVFHSVVRQNSHNIFPLVFRAECQFFGRCQCRSRRRSQEYTIRRCHLSGCGVSILSLYIDNFVVFEIPAYHKWMGAACWLVKNHNAVDGCLGIRYKGKGIRCRLYSYDLYSRHMLLQVRSHTGQRSCRTG